jgi:hypothetical protein
MSRHHMLPPIIYTPEPRPKKVETRKRRIQAGPLDEMDEAGEAHGATSTGRSGATFNKPPPQNFPAIEGSEQKPQHPRGRLSEGTLKAMLQAQELK